MFIDRIKNKIKSGFKCSAEITEDYLPDVIDTALGDPAAAVKLVVALGKSPFLFREKMFYSKLEKFINGVYLDEKDKDKLRKKLAENENDTENVMRLISCIDKIDTEQKINYLINATRCLINDYIDRNVFFRICHIIMNTVEEDLLFLQTHIVDDNESYDYSINVQGLLTSGLVYTSVMDVNGHSQYAFLELAKILDQYSLSSDDVNRYPKLKKLDLSKSEPI